LPGKATAMADIGAQVPVQKQFMVRCISHDGKKAIASAGVLDQ